MQEVVPKMTELNIICREIQRENILYEPEIETEVHADGKKTSKVVVRVYSDRNNSDTSGVIST